MIIENNWIYADLNKQTAAKMDAVWSGKRNKYRLPNTIGALSELMEVGTDHDVLALIEKKKQQRQNLTKLKALEDAPGDERLRPYQRVDVSYLKHIPNAGIFNQQRTGKSPTMLCLANIMDFQTMLIICPASLVINWEDEVNKWTTGEKIVFVANGTKSKRNQMYENVKQSCVYMSCHCQKKKELCCSEALSLVGNQHQSSPQKNILIMSYETCRNDIKELTSLLKKSIDCLAVDEGHRLRNHQSKQSKAIFSLGKLANHRYVLTGTPTVKNGSDIWGILHFLYPDKFPGYWQFVERYFQIKNGRFGRDIGRYKRQSELEEIISTISVNRKRSEVMKWLPKKQYQTIKLEATPQQQKAYDSVKNTFVFEDKVDAPSVLAQLTRLRQLTTSPQLLGIEDPGTKEKFLLEWLGDNDEPVIVFSVFTSYLKQLQPKIKGSVMIHGEMSATEKQESVRKFQSGGSRVLLANIISGSTGFTIDKATTTIFLDKAYNSVDNEQAEDRMVPVSQERNHACNVISLVIKDSLDEHIEEILRRKENIISVVNNAGINTLRRLLDV